MSTTDDHTRTEARPDGAPPRSGQRAHRRGLSWWQAIGAATVAATLVNLRLAALDDTKPGVGY